MTQAKEQLIELGRLSPERFWREWRGGSVYGLPHHTCSSDQAYRAYKHWCVLEGERFPMSKAVFARMVAREADEDLKVRPMWDGKGTVRMWLVTPPPGETDASWVRETVHEFDESIRRWRGDQGTSDE